MSGIIAEHWKSILKATFRPLLELFKSIIWSVGVYQRIQSQWSLCFNFVIWKPVRDQSNSDPQWKSQILSVFEWKFSDQWGGRREKQIEEDRVREYSRNSSVNCEKRAEKWVTRRIRVRSPRAQYRRRLESSLRRQLGQATVAASESPTSRWLQHLEKSQVSESLKSLRLLWSSLLLHGAPCLFTKHDFYGLKLSSEPAKYSSVEEDLSRARSIHRRPATIEHLYAPLIAEARCDAFELLLLFRSDVLQRWSFLLSVKLFKAHSNVLL